MESSNRRLMEAVAGQEPNRSRPKLSAEDCRNIAAVDGARAPFRFACASSGAHDTLKCAKRPCASPRVYGVLP